ncbi:LysR family transcriptional regulator [Marinobacter sp. M3C]|jgi:DNA-binding transcriptional LysR family regulator|uniref:LysR family transcriptional regulator n=1 Tax=unclassified Marinobacter TaxID=83889 RepID=UPI0020101901|nr:MULTISPECIES: LysR family transcriptional regulator [unclassified Marinobacter]MCL1486484.1 LysR family transcriptional regulator [Marinobacter sp.]UQG54690.1 LysR family transcriptional regulator [Marinobacter sp. M4C]UQG59938.1 LysR family transcriptional regulator [Marinobacter sp. M3C]UQG63492.1 LysR family transcriptional regulator [Marinobacter sp. M2C]UQG67775.1 LysR family transcriptional regulator [Marinobacter sp. M1C]
MPLTIQNLASRLTFRQLQVFKAVYDLKNYSKAGELLGLTQPAISSQVRHLEQALGLPMFEYVGRKLYCTAAGEEMAKCVRSVFAALEKMQNNLAALEGQVAGELRLVAVNTAQYVVPYMLGAFLQLNPQVTVSVSVVNRATALQRLNDNADDLVIMGMVPAERPLTSLPFLDNELVPVVPKGHPLLGQANVNAQAFLDSGLLVRESGSGSRLALELYCQNQRLRAIPSMELGSNDAVKHAVLAGLGVAVLPKLGVLSELALGSLSIVNIAGFPLRRSWCVVYPQARHPTPAMRAFIDYVQQNIRRFEQLFLRRSGP